jgi:hypothetical protein
MNKCREEEMMGEVLDLCCHCFQWEIVNFLVFINLFQIFGAFFPFFDNQANFLRFIAFDGELLKIFFLVLIYVMDVISIYFHYYYI